MSLPTGEGVPSALCLRLCMACDGLVPDTLEHAVLDCPRPGKPGYQPHNCPLAYLISPGSHGRAVSGSLRLLLAWTLRRAPCMRSSVSLSRPAQVAAADQVYV